MEPDAKVVKNRLHLDIHVSGGRSVTEGRSFSLATRKQRVDAEAERLADLGATISRAMSSDDMDHYAVGMKDPEGNEFDIN
jgi:Glyoxalase-like domain